MLESLLGGAGHGCDRGRDSHREASEPMSLTLLASNTYGLFAEAHSAVAMQKIDVFGSEQT
jgi:hypothetical protein